jgi:uncharacterized membrane protein
MRTGSAMDKPRTFSTWFYLITAAIGLVDSLYLIWIKIANDKAYCLQGVGDCWSVNTSKYSEVFGIPIAVFGALGYVLILVALLQENRIPFLHTNGVLVQFGLTLTGVLYSAYLTYLELFVIKAICPFCVLSAICMTVLFALTIVRLVKNQAEI